MITEIFKFFKIGEANTKIIGTIADTLEVYATSIVLEPVNDIHEANIIIKNNLHTKQLIENPFLSVKEASEILGFTRKKIYKLLDDGKIKGEKHGAKWHISQKSLKKYIEKKKNKHKG